MVCWGAVFREAAEGYGPMDAFKCHNGCTVLFVENSIHFENMIFNDNSDQMYRDGFSYAN